MGVRGDSGHQRAKPVPTAEQLRFAQLNLEGKSTDDDPKYIQKLIKEVIETTRCSQAQAELALYDNDNDLAAAVDYILEHASEVESWTEQKSKREKKKEEEERRPTRGYSSNRGRGGFTERGGRGRSSGGPSAATKTAFSTSQRGRGGSRQQNSRTDQTQANKPMETFNAEENKSGPMEFKRSAEHASAEQTPSSSQAAPSSVAPVPTTAAGPISFAAVAAAAARKDQQKQQTPTQLAQPVPSSACFDESASTSVRNEVQAEESYHSEPALAAEEEHETTVESENVSSVNVSSTAIQTNTSWTNQLKNELGIGLTPSESPLRQQNQFSSPVSYAPAGVEFAPEAASTRLVDYQFGFVDVSNSASDIPAPPVPSAPTESPFNPTRHGSSNVAQKAVEPERLSNNEYSIKNTSPTAPYGQSTSRSLGFGDASSVSYNPSLSDRVSTSKPSHVPPPQQQNQPLQQQAQTPQQHQMFPHPYTFNYMYNGVRADDPYSAALLQYPLAGMGVDFSSILPVTNTLSQSGNGQQLQGNQHRSDSHSMDGIKYQSQSSREQSQQGSNVAPPPGFANPSYMNQPPLSSLFMQQYTPMQFSYMMPNVGNAGRQMYQEEDRKSYDKMSGAKQAQATPPPHHYNHNGGNYMNINKKQYNWNN
ncbi:unnamed protein product [Auanema sp. JU1783]|nr:unnamed protein product [Auanema sp. JU1783]